MEYEAVDDGVMAKIVVPEGTNDVAVNQLIAVMAQEGEDVKAAAAAAASAPAKAAQRRSPLNPTFSPSGRRSCPASRRALDICSSCPKRRSLRRRRKRRALPLPRGERVGVRGFGPTVMAPAPRHQQNLFFTLGATPGERREHRSRPHPRHRPARPRHRPRRRGGKIGPRLARAGRGARQRTARRAVDVGPADPRALRRRQLRFRAARRHAPHHCATTHGVGADHSAFLPDHRLRHRQAPRGARGDQRRRRPRTRTASRPTSFRSTISSSRRWRSPCSACRTPT